MTGPAAPALVTFLLDGQRFGLALGQVERVLPMVAVTPLPRAPAVTLGLINLHGRVVPVLDARLRLGRTRRDYGAEAHLLVARTSRRVLALPVDEVLGVRELALETVTPASALLPGLGHVAGVAALPDGLLFIHDLETFLSLEEERQLADALTEATA